MAYVEPTSRVTGTKITATIWNQDVVDNVIALKTQVDGVGGWPVPLGRVNMTGTTYTTAAGALIDSANLSLTVTPTGTQILHIVSGVFSVYPNYAVLAVGSGSAYTDITGEYGIYSGAGLDNTSILHVIRAIFYETVTAGVEITRSLKNTGGSSMSSINVVYEIYEAKNA